MTTMKSAEEFKQEALQAIKELGGFPYNTDIYWSYRAVKDIPVRKELYFHPARGDGKSMQWMEQWMEERAYEDIKNTFGEKSAEEAKRYCEKMSDLINREQAIDAIGALSDTIFKNIKKGATYPPRAWFAGMANAESIIKDLPSIDAVPVVRCKDCSNRYTKRCGMFDVEAEWEWTEDNGFCQYGERRKE